MLDGQGLQTPQQSGFCHWTAIPLAHFTVRSMWWCLINWECLCLPAWLRSNRHYRGPDSSFRFIHIIQISTSTWTTGLELSGHISMLHIFNLVAHLYKVLGPKRRIKELCKLAMCAWIRFCLDSIVTLRHTGLGNTRAGMFIFMLHIKKGDKKQNIWLVSFVWNNVKSVWRVIICILSIFLCIYQVKSKCLYRAQLN